MTDRHSRSERAKAGTDFSRLRTTAAADDRPVVHDVPPDQEGKRALFSASNPRAPTDAAASFGAVIVNCGRCEESAVLTPSQALQLAVPSVHLPFLKRGHGSWMRCPSCHHRTWVSVQIQL
jgi:hypothetical protein